MGPVGEVSPSFKSTVFPRSHSHSVDTQEYILLNQSRHLHDVLFLLRGMRELSQTSKQSPWTT